jgi:hypothetical protein
MVHPDGIEPPTSTVSRSRSTTELRTRYCMSGAPGRIRTSEMPRCKRGALSRLATGAEIAGAPSWIRTGTETAFEAAASTVSATGALSRQLVRAERFELPWTCRHGLSVLRLPVPPCARYILNHDT